MVIWLIGLSDAGKTTIGLELTAKIREQGKPVIFLDGDIVRAIFGNDLSHTMEDRKKNADRICRLCQHLESQQVHVVCGILSMFHESQDWNRENLKSYFEVFIDASVEKLKQRDTKGIYAKGKDVVGLDISFPAPKAPNLVIKQDFSASPSEQAEVILGELSL